MTATSGDPTSVETAMPEFSVDTKGAAAGPTSDAADLASAFRSGAGTAAYMLNRFEYEGKRCKHRSDWLGFRTAPNRLA